MINNLLDGEIGYVSGGRLEGWLPVYSGNFGGGGGDCQVCRALLFTFGSLCVAGGAISTAIGIVVGKMNDNGTGTDGATWGPWQQPATYVGMGVGLVGLTLLGFGFYSCCH